MDDRKRTLAAVTILIGCFLLFILVIGALISARRVVSPVPEDSEIKIIFVSPTPLPPTATPSVAPTVKPTPGRKR